MPWHRWREPLAVLLLVVLALLFVLRGIALWQAIEAATMHGALGGLPGGDELLLLATAGAVLWCATPVVVREGEPAGTSPHARSIAIVGLLVVGLTVLGWLALSMWAVVELVRWPTPDSGYLLFVIEGVLRLAIPAVALGLALLAAGRTSAAGQGRGDPVRAELSVATPALPERPAGSSADGETTSANTEPERLPAAWHVDDAAGAVWLTADDAAQGRPGLTWSRPGSELPADAAPADAAPADAAPADAGRAEARPAGTEPQRRIRPSAEDDDDLR